MGQIDATTPEGRAALRGQLSVWKGDSHFDLATCHTLLDLADERDRVVEALKEARVGITNLGHNADLSVGWLTICTEILRVIDAALVGRGEGT